jgi:predicted nucleotidyltransferase
LLNFTPMLPLYQYIGSLNDLCRANHVKELSVFGSALTDRFSAESDIDFVVEFQHLDPFAYSASYFQLKFALQDLFQRPIDLIEAKEIRNPYLREEITSKKHLLYAA